MKKILVIEDDPTIVELLKMILTNEGYMVSTLSDATHFKSKLKEVNADLVLLDLNIAGFDGEIICAYIKGHIDLKTTPIILLSANLNIQQVADKCGAEYYIKKPFELKTLISTVRTYAGANY